MSRRIGVFFYGLFMDPEYAAKLRGLAERLQLPPEYVGAGNFTASSAS